MVLLPVMTTCVHLTVRTVKIHTYFSLNTIASLVLFLCLYWYEIYCVRKDEVFDFLRIVKVLAIFITDRLEKG